MSIQNSLSSITTKFPPPERSRWLKEMEKELKRTPKHADLYWLLEEGIEVPLMPDEQTPDTIPHPNMARDWIISEAWQEAPGHIDWSQMKEWGVSEVELNQVSTHLSSLLPFAPVNIVVGQWKTATLDMKSMEASANIRFLDGPQEYAFATWRIRSARICEGALISDQLAEALESILRNLATEPLCDTSGLYRVYLEADDLFLRTMVTIQALRILLLNLWSAYGYPVDQSANIVLVIQPKPKETMQDHLIKSTAQAMAGVIAGVDIIQYQLNPLMTEEHIRLLRNSNHILRYETHLSSQSHPIAGSYLLQHASSLLAQKVWKKIGG